MITAALGFITPVQGAGLQEVIDVTDILNALGSVNTGHNRRNRQISKPRRAKRRS
jgi:hypothetical protein